MMKIGISLPQDGPEATAKTISRVAERAEAEGIDSLWVADRMLCPVEPVLGYPPPATCSSPLTPLDVLTFVAGTTRSIALGTSAILALFHPPVLLARRLATVDQLSSGRLIVGLAQGWMPEEFEAAGVPAAGVGARFDEYLAVLRAMWGPDPVSHSGRRYRVAPSTTGPKPLSGAAMPIVVGYHTEAGIRRAARVADGLHPYTNDLDKLRADIEVFRRAAKDAGRDVDSLRVILRVDGRPDAVSSQDRPLFHGPVGTWPGDVEALTALGVDHVFLGFGARESSPAAEQLLDAAAELKAVLA